MRIARLVLAVAAILPAVASFRSSVFAIDRVRSDIAGFVGLAARGPLDTPVAIGSTEDFEAIFGAYDPELANPSLAPSVRAFFENGGRRAYIVRVGSAETASLIGRAALRGRPATGLEALGEIDEVAIVAIPGATSIEAARAFVQHASEHGDRFAILDPPIGADPDEVLAYRAAIEDERGHGALYYPWLRAEGTPGTVLSLPPSGFVAGLYAKTSSDEGPWAAPVGDLAGVRDLDRPVDSRVQDLLNPAGVSVIRSFPGRGVVVFGSRTVSSDTELQYVPVRRFLIFLEESIHDGTEWAVFEPNDEPLWAVLRESVSAFLHELWQDGALQGTRPNDAYFVRVDRSTMSDDDIARGRTVILAGVASLRAGDFTTLRVVHERAIARPRFRRGDTNTDGAVDVSDAVATLSWLFLGAADLPCADAADSNDDGALDLSDAVAILDWLFGDGAPPRPPGPSACGEDPTEDRLDPCGDPGSSC